MKGKIIFGVAIFMLIAMAGNNSIAQSDSQMYIMPSSQTLMVGTNFTLNISIQPSQPVAGAQCDILFNPDVIHVLNVSNGGMFDIWMNDLSPNFTKWDNVNGTITNIVAFSFSSTTTAGTFAVIKFQAVGEGTSYINISNGKIADSEGNSVPATFFNATVTVSSDTQPPVFVSHSYDVNKSNFHAQWNATDDITPWDEIQYSYRLDSLSWSAWGKEREVSYSGLAVGTHIFEVRAKDNAGNIANITMEFNIVDEEPPSITGVTATPSTAPQGGNVNISCHINDDFTVANATISIEYPDGVTHQYALIHGSGDTYYYNSTYTQIGTYTFTIHADDGYNAATFSSSFSIIDITPPSITGVAATPSTQNAGSNVNITCIVTDNVAVNDVRVNITYPNGKYYNISIASNKKGNTYYLNETYNLTGNYTFFIWADDGSGNAVKSGESLFTIIDLTPPVMTNITVSPTPQSFGNNVNITCIVTDNVAVNDVRVNITYPDGTYHNMSIASNKKGNTYYLNQTYNTIGTYTFYIWANDSAGNAVRSDNETFDIVDLTPPNVKISYPSGGELFRNNVTIRWNATDNYDSKNSLKVTIKYSDDNGSTWHIIASNINNDGVYTWNVSGLSDGDSYILKISVTDTSGNTGTDMTSKFTIDHESPSLEITKPVAAKLYIFDRAVMPLFGSKAVVIGRITITASVSDDVSGVDRVEFYVDGSLKANLNNAPYEWTWQEMAIGSHVITVKAYDKAGNEIEKEIGVRTIIL